MITGQVDLYLQGTISTGVFDTARIICGSGNGLRIITATAHPILLQTQHATLLIIGVVSQQHLLAMVLESHRV